MHDIHGFSGQLLQDPVTRQLYATDASPYLKLPAGVAQPQSDADCIALVQHCNEHGLSLTPRAAGTSLAGQCVTDGLVVDMGRHLHRILAIEPDQRLVRVQPGVVLADLNDALRPYGLMFPPDPSTATRCQIGGMIGNNAWGVHAPRDGSTRDWVHSLDVVLSDGTQTTLGPDSGHPMQASRSASDRCRQIHRYLYDTISRHRTAILDQYPSTRGIPNNVGYPLDILARQQPWNSRGEPHNLAPFLCGTEGTLALITSATLRLTERPKSRYLLCALFRTMQDALEAVSVARATAATAIELLDHTLLDLTRTNRHQQRNRFWIQDDPAAALLIEFDGQNDESTYAHAITLGEQLRAHGLGYAHPVYGEPEVDMIWDLRRAGLGLLMGLPPERAAVTGIEDSAVAVRELPRYAAEVNALAADLGTTCVMYGSVSMGLIQFRPHFDLRVPEQRQRYARLVNGVAGLVRNYRGSFSSKHGDGRLRARFIEYTLGTQVPALLREIKHIFDPLNIFNPGKVLGTEDLLTDLRPQVHSTASTGEEHAELKQLVGRCHGAGVCLQSKTRGTMCPSYMATRNEQHGTRGRATLLAAMLTQTPPFALTSPQIEAALALCVGCKGCKRECPANVDMAWIKANVLHQRHRRLGIPWRQRALVHFDDFCRFASHVPVWSNRLLAHPRLARLLHLSPERPLPGFTLQRFAAWMKYRPRPGGNAQRGHVVLLLDAFTEHFEPRVAQAAVTLLEHLGFQVLPAMHLTTGRLAISLGLLDHARRSLRHCIRRLRALADPDLPIVGLEPSEILTLRDEALVLLPAGTERAHAETLARRCWTLEEFISRNAREQDWEALAYSAHAGPVLVHVHCHEKAMLGRTAAQALFEQLPGYEVQILNTGCCGMAGTFGYEAGHYATSRAIGELTLLPAVRAAGADAIVVANGASCRQQIRHGSGVEPLHTAELLCAGLNVHARRTQ